MQLLRFNGYAPNKANDVDIDEKTTIGITVQAYDLTKSCARKVNVSNTFSIPKTNKNLKILQFPDNVQSTSDVVYNSLLCEYWVDNLKLIDGKCYIKSINDRINIVMYSKQDMWSLLNMIKWEAQPDFVDQTGDITEKVKEAIIDGFQHSLIKFLNNNYNGLGNDYGTENGYGSELDPFVYDTNQFMLKLIANTKGITLPYFFSNLYDEPNALENSSNLTITYNNRGSLISGGHLCVYATTIFEYIEDLFGVNFSVKDPDEINNNIFSDDIAKNIIVPIRNIVIRGDFSNGWYFDYVQNTFSPNKEKDSYKNKTVYDFTKSFFALFNCLIDTNDYINITQTYTDVTNYNVRRFDEITSAPIVDFSGNFTGSATFSPILGSNIKQNNYVVYSNVYEGGVITNETSKYFVCNNRNIDIGGTENQIVKVDGYVNNSILVGDTNVADLRKSESFKTFSFLLKTNYNLNASFRIYDQYDISSVVLSVPVAAMYSLSNEYQTVAYLANKPKVYSIKKWLGLHEIYNLKFFRRYYIKELNGFFFINKISGFNPNKSISATTIELIKIY